MNREMIPKSTPTNTKREKLAASKLLNLSLFLRNNTMGRPIKEIMAATTRYISKTFNSISRNIPNEINPSLRIALIMPWEIFLASMC
jgi:hypothetical protein